MEAYKQSRVGKWRVKDYVLTRLWGKDLALVAASHVIRQSAPRSQFVYSGSFLNDSVRLRTLCACIKVQVYENRKRAEWTVTGMLNWYNIYNSNHFRPKLSEPAWHSGNASHSYYTMGMRRSLVRFGVWAPTLVFLPFLVVEFMFGQFQGFRFLYREPVTRTWKNYCI